MATVRGTQNTRQVFIVMVANMPIQSLARRRTLEIEMLSGQHSPTVRVNGRLCIALQQVPAQGRISSLKAYGLARAERQALRKRTKKLVGHDFIDANMEAPSGNECKRWQRP